jgi:hypothetical protein
MKDINCLGDFPSSHTIITILKNNCSDKEGKRLYRILAKFLQDMRIQMKHITFSENRSVNDRMYQALRKYWLTDALDNTLIFKSMPVAIQTHFRSTIVSILRRKFKMGKRNV